MDLVSCFQVALTAPSGSSRGFAFVDMSSAEEAERAQLRCNGVEFAGQEIRVSFGMPCRPGACILQHRNTVPYNVSGNSCKISCAARYYNNYSYKSLKKYNSFSGLLPSVCIGIVASRHLSVTLDHAAFVSSCSIFHTASDKRYVGEPGLRLQTPGE